MSAPSIVIPGQRIGKVDPTHIAGSGTYVRNGFIHSSLAGFIHNTEAEDGKECLEVKTEESASVVPSVGSLVTARVTSVNPRFCKCSILSVDSVTLRETFRGIIRKEDVRSTEKDKIEMYKNFRPADIVLARVLSLGDAHSYVLTTSENELGVVIATSEAGATMVPISWCEMQCPRTLAKELRKVAKVQPEHISLSSRKT